MIPCRKVFGWGKKYGERARSLLYKTTNRPESDEGKCREMKKGFIFDIQRFSLHDGPGIRTTVFFKGCPLRCQWCQNPEGLSSKSVLFRYPNRCIGCRACIENCPEKAVVFNESGPIINRPNCALCFKCAEICPAEAMQKAGEEITVSELMGEVLKDRVIFEESGGGATISGGEPLMQPDFLTGLLKALKEEAVHTAVETSGCAPWPALEKTIKWTDLFLYDLKLVDSEKSKRYTGASSTQMLSNLKSLKEKGCQVRVRMPLIPSVNDDRENLRQIADFLKECGLKSIELIPCHNLGTAKYNNLGLQSDTACFAVPSPEKIANVQSFFKRDGLNIVGED